MAIRGRTLMKEIPLTITAGAYAAGDVLGGEIDLGIVGSGRLLRATLADDDNIRAALKMRIFRGNIPDVADNAPMFPMAFADLQKQLAVIAVAQADYEQVAGPAASTNAWVGKDLNVDFFAPSSSNSLRMYLVVDATPTYLTTTALHLTVIYWKD